MTWKVFANLDGSSLIPLGPFLLSLRPDQEVTRVIAQLGVNQCSVEDLQRWCADKYRFPPYQYIKKNLHYK